MNHPETPRSRPRADAGPEKTSSRARRLRVVGKTGDVALRADLTLAFHGVDVLDPTVVETTVTSNASGKRFLLTGGVEF